MFRRLCVFHLFLLQISFSQDLPSASVIPGSTIISTQCDYRFSLNLAPYTLDTKCIKIKLPTQISFLDDEVTSTYPQICETVAGDKIFTCSLKSKSQITIQPISSFESSFVIKIGRILNYKYATNISNYDLLLLSSCDDSASTLYTINFRMMVSFSPGQFPTKSVTPGSFKVFEEVTYTLELKSEHIIEQNGKLYFEFPKKSFYINTKQDFVVQGYIGAKPSSIPTFTVQDLTTSFSFLVAGLFTKEYNPTTDGNITIILSKVHNPRSITLSESIIVESRNASGELTIDSVGYGLEVTPITPCDITKTAMTFPDDPKVRLMTNYYFQATSVLGIYGAIYNLIVEITFPSQIDPSDVTCEYTFLAASTSTTCKDSGQVVTITKVGIYELIQFKIQNLRNPTTDITSDYIKFYIYDSSRNLMCANDKYDRVTAKTNTFTEITARRPTPVVGMTGSYELTFKLATELDQLGQFEVRIPRNQVELINTADVNSIVCNDMSTSVDRCPTNSLSDSEIVLTLRQWCGTYCAAGTSVSMRITGIRNPYYADNTVTSSVKIYNYIPGTPNGYVDKIETGIKFKDDLVGKEITTTTIARSSNTVGVTSVLTMSFKPTIPYTAGFKLVVEFPMGGAYIETQAVTGESSFTSDFSSKTALICSSSFYITDSSIKLVTCTGASQGSPLDSTIYFRLSNVINRYDIKDLSSSTYKLLINTSSGFAIEYGTLAQNPSLGVYTTNSLSNFSISRTNNTVFKTTNILISFKSSTKLPADAIITVTVPSDIIIRNKNQSMECYRGVTKLSCSILFTSSNGSITSFKISDYCSSLGCSSSNSFSLTLTNLINPESVLNINGLMQIITNSGSFDVDIGSSEVSVTLGSLIPGRLFDLDIHPMNPSINQSPLYRFTFSTEHPVPSNAYISITWPSQLELDGTQSLTQLFGFTSTSAVLEKSSLTLKLRSGFPTGTSSPVLIGFYISFFKHNNVAQTTAPFEVSIRTSSDSIVDQDSTKSATILTNQGSCSTSCNSCAGSASTCYSCKIPSTVPFLVDYSCSDLCPTQYFLMSKDSDKLACIKCPYYCEECVASDKCTKCKASYMKWGGDCVESCPDDTVLVNGICKTKGCSNDCGECSKSDYCLNCASNTVKPVFLADLGTCYPTATNGVDNCAEGYYQDITTNCLKCNAVCRDCTGSAGYCTACTSYYDKLLLDLTINTCVKACTVGKTIQDGLYCRPCHSSCDTCLNFSETGCDKCPSIGTIYKTTTGKCVTNCNTENLKNYLNPTSSIYECISSCPSTRYYDDNGTCRTCQGVCLTCNSSDRCLTCDTSGSTPYLQTSSSLCVSTCTTAEYFYELNSKKECLISCPVPSLKYTNPTTGRKECIEISSCPITKYFIKSSESCEPCDISCLTCGGTSSTCLSCDLTGTFSFLTSDHRCIQQCIPPFEYKIITTNDKRCYDTCPLNTYGYNSGMSKDCISECPSKTFKNNTVCTPCWSTCRECSGPTGSDCILCDKSSTTPYLTDSKSCVSLCDSNFYKLEIDGEKRCVTNCAPTYNNYSGPVDKLCIEQCPSNTYLNISKNCVNCDPSCLTCTTGGADKCKTCDTAGTYPYYDNGYCRSTCLTTQYAYTDNGVKYCLQDCPDGLYKLSLVSGRSCVSSCPDGYYINRGFCSVCHPACLRCTAGSYTECTECKMEYLEHLSTQCVSDCPTGYKASYSVCEKDCEQTGCKACDSFALDKCNVCKEGYLMYEQVCYTECPKGTYNTLGTCKTCSEVCKTCTGPSSSECLSCSSELYLHLNECVRACPYGFSGLDGKCVAGCMMPCATCIEDSVSLCDTCMPETSIIYNQMCYSVCPSGTYQETNTCKVCDTTCKECSGSLTINCSVCKTGNYLNPDMSCQEFCPDGFIEDSTMKICQEVIVVKENDTKSSGDESQIQGYPVYILIGETGFLMLLLILSSILKHDSTHKVANFLALMGIVEFSERLMLLIFLIIENGPYADIQFALVGGFTLATLVNSMIFSKLYFDSLIESSMTFNMYVTEHKKSFYAIYYLSLLFSVNFIRLLYGGLFGIAALTIPKSLETVSAFRIPLERISFLKICAINIPHMIQQISVLCTWGGNFNSFQICGVGIGVNACISIVYMLEWRKSVWIRS